jgi:hypothetical protein
MKRNWLIGALVLLAGGAAVSCGDDSGGSPGEDEGETRRRVAEALTEGIEFEGGRVELEPMPDTTDEDLVIEQDDAPISLEPGVASLLPFDIENDDEEDPVVATLLQFEDAEDDQHVEIELEEGVTMAEVMLDVQDDVCDTLCADSFAVKLIQALKTKGGRIGQRITRTLMLTCDEDGPDATMCESAAGDGDGDGDGDAPGDGDGDGDIDLVGSADGLSSQALQINRALCACNSLPPTCTQHRWITQLEIECVSTAIENDPTNDSANLMALVDAIPGALSGISGACDPMGIFSLLAPTADLQELPADVLACDEDMNTFYPSGGASDAGADPAP